MALSMDLRVRVLAAIDDGISCRAAAARFGVAPSTAIHWHAQRHTTGSVAPWRANFWPLEPYRQTADIFQADECANYFSSCGFDPE